MKRRQFIKTTAGAATILSYSPFLKANETIDKVFQTFDAEINLTASPMEVSLLPGNKTNMLCLNGSVVKGDSHFLKSSQGYLGPSFEVRRGERIKVNFKNNLSEASIIHWHGLDLPEAQDGHPSYAIEPNESYTYDLEIHNRAGLYWYHPHPHGRTGYQVYHGMAGLFVVRDNEEDKLNLPAQENELFFVLQDRHFDENNQLIYVQSGHDIMMGKVGDKLLVNGSLDRERKVAKEAYRLRFLNGGNALTYRLQWSDGKPVKLIGTDGGLLEELTDRDSVLFSPGERIDLLVDFSDKNIGDEVELQSIPLVDNSSSQPFTVYKFKITKEGVKNFDMPTQLSVIKKIESNEAVNIDSPKVFKLAPKAGVGWTIDDLGYEMNNIRPKERVKLGTTEIWEFDLTNAGMVHPMHIHGSQFQVLERIPGPYSKDIVFDGGWKDTVAVLPGDRVRIIKRFHDFEGKFLFHCHILEHEDHSMMRDFLVEK